MMKYAIYLFVFFFLSFSKYAFPKHFKAGNSRIRTDGFYFYDNGIDTLVIIPGGGTMQIQMIQLMQAQGLLSRNIKFTGDDSIAINSEGSTAIDVIAFFNKSSGTEYGTSHRRDGFIQDLINTINRRKAITDTANDMYIHDEDSLITRRFDKTTLISDITFLNDTTLIFTIGKGYEFLEKRYTCIMNGDRLNVTVVSSQSPGSILYRRMYVFIPFNNIPTDLLKVKK